MSKAENPSTNGAGPEKRAETFRRACTGVTRQGQPCKAAPLKGSDVCMAHSDAKTRESVGFVPVNGKAGRKRSPKVVDILRERLEAQADEWLKVLEDARTADRGVVVGDGPAARIEYVEDHATRLKAFREVFDRGYGKPMQYHDVTTREEESDVDREIRDLLEQMDHLPTPQNGNGKVPH